MKTVTFILSALALWISLGASSWAADKGTVLVTGANRGLGLEFVRQLTAAGYKVIGTSRNPAEAPELRATGARVEALDVSSQDSVAALAATLKGVPIDILINNAGVATRADSSLATIDYDAMLWAFRVNTLGPLRVTQALLPNLESGAGKTIVNISSRLGSIEASTGGLYSYRTSKTALNQVNKLISLELAPRGFTTIVMHPGWVQTDMGGAEAPLKVEESIAGMIAVIEGLEADSNGRFYDYTGQQLPW